MQVLIYSATVWGLNVVLKTVEKYENFNLSDFGHKKKLIVKFTGIKFLENLS